MWCVRAACLPACGCLTLLQVASANTHAHTRTSNSAITLTPQAPPFTNHPAAPPPYESPPPPLSPLQISPFPPTPSPPLQARGISIKAMPMSLLLEGGTGKNFLINAIDCPGHVNFNDEVRASRGRLGVVAAGVGRLSTATRLAAQHCSGAIGGSNPCVSKEGPYRGTWTPPDTPGFVPDRMLHLHVPPSLPACPLPPSPAAPHR